MTLRHSRLYPYFIDYVRGNESNKLGSKTAKFKSNFSHHNGIKRRVEMCKEMRKVPYALRKHGWYFRFRELFKAQDYDT